MTTKGQRMPFSQVVQSRTVPPLPHFSLHSTGHLADNNFPSLARKTTLAVGKIFMFMKDLKSLQVLIKSVTRNLKSISHLFCSIIRSITSTSDKKNSAKPTTYNTRMMG